MIDEVQEVESTEEVVTEVEESPIEAKEAAPVVEDKKEFNFRELRRAKEQAEYEREQALRERDEMRAYLQAQQQRVPQSPPELEDEDLDIDGDDDSYVEVRNVRKVQKGVKNVKSELAKTKEELKNMMAEMQLKTKYSDFDFTVNKENLALLRAKKPSLAKSIASNPDFFSQAEAAYEAIKDHITGAPIPTYEREKDRIAANLAKPRPAISDTTRMNKSALSQADAYATGLTSDVMLAMRKEMDEARSRW